MTCDAAWQTRHSPESGTSDPVLLVLFRSVAGLSSILSTDTPHTPYKIGARVSVSSLTRTTDTHRGFARASLRVGVSFYQFLRRLGALLIGWGASKLVCERNVSGRTPSAAAPAVLNAQRIFSMIDPDNAMPAKERDCQRIKACH